MSQKTEVHEAAAALAAFTLLNELLLELEENKIISPGQSAEIIRRAILKNEAVNAPGNRDAAFLLRNLK